MSTSVRKTSPVHQGSGRRWRLLTALLAALATVTGPLVVAGAPAEAGPIDTGWAVTAGAGVVPGSVSDGAASAATFSYDLLPAGVGVNRSWDFTVQAATAATPGDPIKVPWTWQGLHAWFGVTAQLQPIVNGVPVDLPNGQTVGTYLVNAGPQNCCTTPSNGFLFGNVATFTNVPANATYGFRLTGRNSDSNNFLRGTFTLSTRPYIDATIGSDNRQWIGAADLSTAGLNGKLTESGEARWYKFPVFPGQTATVDLTNLSRDYDLALYGDIGAAFNRLLTSDDLTQLAAASAATAPGSGTQVSSMPEEVTDIPTTGDELSSRKFAPRVYAPRVYAPRVYAPRVYAPRVYAPRVYAPRVYAPNSYAPDLQADPTFRDAFSAAQDQTLLVASVNTGSGTPERVTASTGNTQQAAPVTPGLAPVGFFYVRVQGHDDKVFDAANEYHLALGISGIQDCVDLNTHATTPTIPPTGGSPRTVIVTDTNKLSLTNDPEDDEDPYDTYMASLDALADSTGGVVVDVRASERVRELQKQAADRARCPYAANLVADAIKDIVDSYRTTDNTNLQYVVIAGGDEVIPFFRYPDTAGLGEEEQYSPPMLDDTPAGGSLDANQVLSQDAYGARREVTIGGATIPVADLAVGRLVKTPEEIESTIGHYLAPGGSTLPITGAGSSLVTGYDFLADAAKRVHGEFQTALPGGANDTLIEELGVDPEDSWTADDLRAKLFGSHHNLIYLAGHFSAQDTLAADFDTTVEAAEIAAAVNAGKLTDSLVLSAGCHSGYSIVETEAGAGVVVEDWSQRLAQQHALLIGGTGYQYGDSDFLEYSERLYLGIAQRLREGPTSGDAPAVAIGQALTLAKQDYLATLSTLQGIDQKAVLQATLYGLPMTGFDAPGRKPLENQASVAAPAAATSGPGQTLGLWTDDLDVATPLDVPTGVRHTKASPEAALLDLPGQLTWREGLDGVTVEPGLPALPKQVVNVTVEGDQYPDLVLRGVGFRSGSYKDTTGLLPLTGAPAIEGATSNTTFFSPTFFPQKLATANYFGALGASGRTSLILSPAQYRNDADIDPQLPTNTERAYSGLGLRLFYSGDETEAFGANKPALASAPAITDVQGTLGTDGKLRFRVRATGDPSAGVQQVWATWTGGPDGQGNGSWQSVDLSQDPLDSTLWTGVTDAPQGQDRSQLRFLVQAANGVGAVGLDTADGDGYPVDDAADLDTANVSLAADNSPLGVTATVTEQTGQPIAGRKVTFSVIQGGAAVFGYDGVTNTQGQVALGPVGQQLPAGAYTVVAYIFNAQNLVTDSATLEFDTALLTLEKGVVSSTSPLGVTAVVTTSDDRAVTNRLVTFTVSRNDVDLFTVTGRTDSTGRVPVLLPTDKTHPPAGELVVTAEISLSTGGTLTESVTTTIATAPVTISASTPDNLATLANTVYTVTTPISATVRDDYGVVPFYPVTFTFPSSEPSATFQPVGLAPTRAVQISTNGDGVAAVPLSTVIRAGVLPGPFVLTIASGGATRTIPFAAQYRMAPFVSPVSSSTTTNSTGTTPVKIAALLANGSKISDSQAALLVQQGRLQIRFRQILPTSTSTWSLSPAPITYDATKDFFQADLKASATGLKWTKNNTYRVDFRILAPTSTLQGTFDLGSRSFDIKVTK